MLLILVFLMSEVIGAPPLLSFATGYLLVYFFDYLLTAIFVFRGKLEKIQFRRYIYFQLMSFLLGVIVFGLIEGLIPHVLVSTIITAAALLPFRFAVSRLWVFKTP